MSITTESQGRKFNVYAVKDELVGKFLQPIFIETNEEAIRWFKYVLNDTAIWKSNAAMYTLYKIGEFNDRKGYTDTEIEMIQGGLSVVERKENA